ncbi:YbdD/YjiX family protein [Corynebacterium sp.]|uniref:YbdD/YjiX family protein n=1 Tax=Corynebacterium sp. TaxID=1720 RepID=UPI003736F788
MVHALVKATASISWYFKELMGDNDYKKYCAHLATHHPGTEVPSEREYWKRRWAHQEANPQGRCC